MPSSEEQVEQVVRDYYASIGVEPKNIDVVDSGRNRLHVTVDLGPDLPREYSAFSREQYPDTDS